MPPLEQRLPWFDHGDAPQRIKLIHAIFATLPSDAIRGSYEGVIRQLEEELREYDQLKSGDLELARIDRLDEIAPFIVKLRIGSPETPGSKRPRSLLPQYDEFKARTIWSLWNAFTSAFKELDPILQFKATAKLAGFIEGRLGRGF